MSIRIIILLILFQQVAIAQKNESFYVFDKNGKATTLQNARFLLRSSRINDTSWRWEYYYYDGPMIWLKTTKDKNGEILHGIFSSFNSSGGMDSTGHYFNGYKQGDWYTCSRHIDSGIFKLKEVFDKGMLLSTEDLTLKKTKGNASIINPDNDSSEIESQFPNGARGWQQYLIKNLRYPERAMNLHSQGKVTVAFVIDSVGKVKDPFIFESVEISLDQEALRIINNTPKWIPSVKDGLKVKSYKLQPITFMLSGR